VVATFREPFDVLAETVMSAARIGANDAPKSSKSEIWLGDLEHQQIDRRRLKPPILRG
jgi:site-specific DNA recombinase